MNVAEPLHRWAQRTPDATAVVSGDRDIPYRAMDAAVSRAAYDIRAAGVAPGDCVAVGLRDPVMQLVVMLALARSGAVQLPLPTDGGADDAACRFGATLLITDDVRLRAATLPSMGPQPEWLDGAPAPDAAGPGPGGDAPWMIVHSSGTTGAPKATIITHAMENARTALQPDAVACRPGERFCCLIGLGFRVARMAALRCLSQGAAFVVAPANVALAALALLIDRHRVALMLATPSQLARLAAHLPADGPRWPGIRVLRTTSGAVTQDVVRAIRTRISPSLHVDYGVNDAGTLAIAYPEDLARHPATAGRPLPGLELQIVDDRGRRLPAGTAGHVRVRGPGIAERYVGDPEATRTAFRDGWFHPGDYGVLDAEGLLFVQGRIDDLMNVGGVKVAPREIEAVLLDHPGVADAVAFPLRSALGEEVPAAAVILDAPVALDGLRELCRRRLGATAPRHIFAVRELPRNAMGKTQRGRLAEMAARFLARPTDG